MITYLPVIFVCFGNIPDFLHVNIELTARKNPVVILSNQTTEGYSKNNNPNVTYENLTNYLIGANEFSPHYKHLHGIPDRFDYENWCFQRWFILRDYMLKKDIKTTFFSDGDSVIFVNVLEASKLRADCDAVINVEYQESKYHWVAAGEASIWSLDALIDFCRFILEFYSNKIFEHTLRLKYETTPHVVDMSVMYLWWVAHHTQPGWDAGRSYITPSGSKAEAASIQHERDADFIYVKSLPMPLVNTNNSSNKLELCNGMDVVNRTVFDHRHGYWQAKSKIFNLNVEGNGRPFIIAASLINGGKPESIKDKDVAQLQKQSLFLNNIHYQGNFKHMLFHDACRTLKKSGGGIFYDPTVEKICKRHQ